MTANMENGGVAGIDGMLNPSDVAKTVIETVSKGGFLILPHPVVGEYIKFKTATFSYKSYMMPFKIIISS